MYLGDIINGFSTFIHETDFRVKRVHITHTDMDGVSCTIMRDAAIESFTNQDSKSPMTTIYLPKPSLVNAKIVEAAETCLEQGFDRTSEIMAFLITDLAGVDESVFEHIRKNLGIPCYYVVIDHHQTSIENHACMDLIHSMDKEIVRCGGYYFTHVGLCATYIMYSIVRDLFGAMATKRLGSTMPIDSNFADIAMFMTHTLADFADVVNRYDTGAWGKWNTPNVEEVAPEVLMQLIFKFYRKNYEAAKNDLITIMKNGEGADAIRESYGQIATEAHKNLLKEYGYVEKYIKNSNSTDMSFNIGDVKVRFPIRVKYLEHREGDMNFQYFSLISREVLESSDDIDIFALVDYVRGTVELRSADKKFDVGLLARRNGGGGHFHASGFPFTIPEKKEGEA